MIQRYLWLARASANASFIGADTSNGANRNSGKSMPASCAVGPLDGRRSTWPGSTKSTTNTTSASATSLTPTIPTPLTSIWPLMLSGAVATTRSPSRRTSTWSSATRAGGSSAAGPRRAKNRKRRAKSDFPEPDGPRSSAAFRPSATHVACTNSGSADKLRRSLCGRGICSRQAHRKARANDP